jgi:hydroxymethylbilane synthase
LLAGEADIAVHSLKDVPAELAPGLHIGCVPLREDARDAIKTRTGCSFKDLPTGARVGTSSLRRTIQLRAVRPDLEYVPLRGNIDTRLRRCEEGVIDAVVLAYAGLRRLGRADAITELLSPDVCLPAVGQGALGIEIRASDEGIASLVAELEDADSAILTASERGVLVAVDGSCQVPVAAYAERIGTELRLRALLANPDGSDLRREELRPGCRDGRRSRIASLEPRASHARVHAPETFASLPSPRGEQVLTTRFIYGHWPAR